MTAIKPEVLQTFGLDVAKAHAVLAGVREKIQRVMERRVGHREAFSDLVSDTIKKLWKHDAMPFEDQGKVSRTIRALFAALAPDADTPEINYKNAVLTAEDKRREEEEKHKSQEKEKKERKSKDKKEKKEKEREDDRRKEQDKVGETDHNKGKDKMKGESNTSTAGKDRSRSRSGRRSGAFGALRCSEEAGVVERMPTVTEKEKEEEEVKRAGGGSKEEEGGGTPSVQMCYADRPG